MTNSKDKLIISQLEEKNERQAIFLEVLYASLVNGITQHAYDDTDGYLNASDQIFNLLGYTKSEFEELYGKDLMAVVLPEDKIKFKTAKKNLIGIGDVSPIEFRITNKQGEIRWLGGVASRYFNEAGIDIIQTEIYDITEQKKSLLELKEEKERYNLALSGTKDTIFEYYYDTDTLFTYGSLLDPGVNKSRKIFQKNFSKRVCDGKIVVEEDILKTLDFLSVKTPVATELRFLTSNADKNQYIWILAEGKRIVSEQKSVKTIGRLRNIDNEKKAELRLLDQLYNDSLTGLLRTERGVELISSYMQNKPGSDKAALLIIDVDDFESINESYSSLFGDAILEEIAQCIKNNARQGDILVRNGGDVFFALLKNISVEETKLIASNIQQSIVHIYTGENEDINISCSIGINAPASGEYDQVVSLASQALQYTKLFRRGGISLYQELSAKEKASVNNRHKGHFKNKSIDNNDYYANIVAYASNYLETNKEVNGEMGALLLNICKQKQSANMISDLTSEAKSCMDDKDKLTAYLDRIEKLAGNMMHLVDDILDRADT